MVVDDPPTTLELAIAERFARPEIERLSPDRCGEAREPVVKATSPEQWTLVSALSKMGAASNISKNLFQ